MKPGVPAGKLPACRPHIRLAANSLVAVFRDLSGPERMGSRLKGRWPWKRRAGMMLAATAAELRILADVVPARRFAPLSQEPSPLVTVFLSPS
jgi:hypothetical protein